MAGVGITFFTILPLLTLVLLARGHGPTFAVPRSARHLSYVIVFFEYVIGTLIFYLSNAIILFVIGLIYITIIAALMIINLFWKISVHSAGISGPATFCIYIFGPVTIWAFPLIVFVLLVLWARWRLQAHNVSQLAGGTLVASIITLLISYISL
jgi:membrane-associated phospholipid phosphatase